MDVKIEKLVYGGDGLGHHDGQTVFVPFVLPGETVTVRPIERKKKFVRACVERVLTPSAERTTPACRHYGVCGGCHYQHVLYEGQLRYKAEILRETLRRIGRVQWEGPIAAHASPPFGYRNRAQWAVRPGAEAGAGQIGYFQAGSSALCAVEECPVLSPRVAEALATLRGLLAAGKLAAKLREVEVFADASDAHLLLNASLERFDVPAAQLAEALRNALAGAETILLHDSSHDHFELFGPGFIHYEAGGTRYRVGHLSFFQVNRFLVDELVRAIAGEEQGRLALDLFAGVGLFTIPLARRFERVVSVESNLAAVRDLEANIQDNDVPARWVQDDVESYLARSRDTPDFVVLDPPRAGVAPRALTRLTQLAPTRIAYLSCDPATLARDVGTLTGAVKEPGAAAQYDISEVHLFDIFPQTYHIEALVKLRRRG